MIKFLERIITLLTRLVIRANIIDGNKEKLNYNVNIDALTGLQNLTSCSDVLNNAIKAAKNNLALVGVYLIDLDRFKFINDTLGHKTGDRFIISVADRLKEMLPGNSTVGRIGGDKFIVIAEGLHEEREVSLYANEIMSLFVGPFSVKDREMYISAAVGSSLYPYDGQNAEVLLKNAEIAMYRAKELGLNMCCRYENDLIKTMQKKLNMDNKLRRAINDGCQQFQMYYQPKVSTETGEIMSCEILIRWNTPEGILCPDEFIPFAEESGLILPLSTWVIQEAFRCEKMFSASKIDTTISINIPAQVLLNKSFIDTIKTAALENGSDIRKLDIEITEATLIKDMVRVNHVLNDLRTLGVTISIDDFGTGYSSLSYLKELPIDRIKIDKSFITGLNDNDEDKTIVKSIVAMAKGLRMLVTAEGVENTRQYEYLKSIKCEEIQGYYISKPVPYDEYVHFYKNRGFCKQ